MNDTAKSRIIELSGLKIPRDLSPAAVGFIAEHYRLAVLETFLLRTQSFVLQHIDQAVDYFVNDNNNPLTKGFYTEEEIPEIFSSQFFTKTHKALIEEVFLCKSVENFLKYLVDLLALVFRSRPETLRTNEQEKLSYILNFSDMESLIDAIAEKKVEKLSYLGTQELFEYFSTQLGFEIFSTPKGREEMAEAIEIRNAIVHNRGRVSRVFKVRIPNSSQSIGELIILPDASFATVKLVNLVMNIDQRAIEKWGFPILNRKRNDESKPSSAESN